MSKDIWHILKRTLWFFCCLKTNDANKNDFKTKVIIIGDYNMCGIVGYIGENKALPVLLNGLSKLEYRGYDSSGIALLEDSKLFC